MRRHASLISFEVLKQSPDTRRVSYENVILQWALCELVVVQEMNMQYLGGAIVSTATGATTPRFVPHI